MAGELHDNTGAPRELFGEALVRGAEEVVDANNGGVVKLRDGPGLKGQRSPPDIGVLMPWTQGLERDRELEAAVAPLPDLTHAAHSERSLDLKWAKIPGQRDAPLRQCCATCADKAIL